MDNLGHDGEIEVFHEERAVTGYLEDYDLDYQLAVVKITSSLDVQTIPLNPAMRFLPNCGVVAVRRDISGKLMATSGKLTLDSCVTEDSELLMFSTCKLSEAWEGGPLVDFLGYFVGMNLLWGPLFLPMSIIMERLDHFKTSQQRNFFLARVKNFEMMRVGERLTDDISRPKGEYTVVPSTKVHAEDAPYKYQFARFEALCYPTPSKCRMILVNSCEASFGDLFPGGVWRRLHKSGSAYRISHSVVSLASFKVSFTGRTKMFACSGFFIDWDDSHSKSASTILTSASLVRSPDGENELADDFTIEVLLPEGERREGTLIHYNLHYNVALVSVKNFRAEYPANLKHEWVNESKLVAVGRRFDSGDLMASRGKLVGWSGPLQCRMLQYSTCKITKAGIGGPVVDYKGRFVGMNFYDPKMGTPFLFCDDIVAILESFNKKGTRAEVDNFRINGDDSIGLNWWPVPRPYLRHPEDPVHDYMDEHEREILDSGCKYKYQGGVVHICK
ncbi:unnamed protein product [Urochloa decumbens]|uniref:Uncharacterized protein n=1 Tax=Urochloa decumbens TaxID=240449 RepID=A0ABC9FH97_9POAL